MRSNEIVNSLSQPIVEKFIFFHRILPIFLLFHFTIKQNMSTPNELAFFSILSRIKTPAWKLNIFDILGHTFLVKKFKMLRGKNLICGFILVRILTLVLFFPTGRTSAPMYCKSILTYLLLSGTFTFTIFCISLSYYSFSNFFALT